MPAPAADQGARRCEVCGSRDLCGRALARNSGVVRLIDPASTCLQEEARTLCAGRSAGGRVVRLGRGLYRYCRAPASTARRIRLLATRCHDHPATAAVDRVEPPWADLRWLRVT
jgi:hypothetical protein